VNVRFEFGTNQGTSTGMGPLLMRNLHDKVDFVRLWHYDPEIEGGVTIFSGD